MNKDKRYIKGTDRNHYDYLGFADQKLIKIMKEQLCISVIVYDVTVRRRITIVKFADDQYLVTDWLNAIYSDSREIIMYLIDER